MVGDGASYESSATRCFSSRELSGLVASLGSGGTLCPLVVRGESMRPTLRAGVDTVYLRSVGPSDEVRPGDIVFFWRDERVVLHRVVGVAGPGILKVNGELERVADLASNIAARAIDLAADPAPPADCRFDFAPIVERAHKMLRGALDAFVCHRPDLARKLILDDDAVDALNAACYADAREKLIKHPAHAGRILDGVTISHCIERIADIATNICEDVIYLEEGQIVRHQKRLAQ